jgi:hypothetical protein
MPPTRYQHSGHRWPKGTRRPPPIALALQTHPPPDLPVDAKLGLILFEGPGVAWCAKGQTHVSQDLQTFDDGAVLREVGFGILYKGKSLTSNGTTASNYFYTESASYRLLNRSST